MRTHYACKVCQLLFDDLLDNYPWGCSYCGQAVHAHCAKAAPLPRATHGLHTADFRLVIVCTDCQSTD